MYMYVYIPYDHVHMYTQSTTHSIDLQSHSPNLATMHLDQLGPAYSMSCGSGRSKPWVSQWWILMQSNLKLALSLQMAYLKSQSQACIIFMNLGAKVIFNGPALWVTFLSIILHLSGFWDFLYIQQVCAYKAIECYDYMYKCCVY